MKIIAHRGNFKPEGSISTIKEFIVPENTIESFENAFENGFGIETDVRKTYDNKFVLLHDADLKKFSGSNIRVENSSLSEIKNEKNSNFFIPTLDELANLAQNYEIKTHMLPFIAFQIKPGNSFATAFAVASILDKYKLTNCIVFDVTIDVAQKLREKFPWLNLSVSLGEKKYSETIYTPSEVFSKKFYSIYNCVWADEWKENGSIYNKDVFKKIKTFYSRIDVVSPELHMLENHPFANNLTQIQSLWKEIISWNLADGICTDYPSILKKI